MPIRPMHLLILVAVTLIPFPTRGTLPAEAGQDSQAGVHLASYRKPENGVKGWAVLLKLHPELKETGHALVKVDLGPKGIYHRLIAGPMTKARARELAEILSAKGQYADVVSGPGRKAQKTAGISKPRQNDKVLTANKTPGRVGTGIEKPSTAKPVAQKAETEKNSPGTAKGANVVRTGSGSLQPRAKAGPAAAGPGFAGSGPGRERALSLSFGSARHSLDRTRPGLPAVKSYEGTSKREVYAGFSLGVGPIKFTPGLTMSRQGDFGPYAGFGFEF